MLRALHIKRLAVGLASALLVGFLLMLGAEAGLIVTERARARCVLVPIATLEIGACLNSLNVRVKQMVLLGDMPGALDVGAEGMPTLPLSGPSHQLTLLCGSESGWQTFVSDRFGFSNPDSVWNYPELDAVLVGDSYPAGQCLPLHQRFATILQTNNPRILNLGYPNSGPLAGLARYIEYAERLHPRYVFYFYYEGNDPDDMETEMAHPILRHYLSPGFRQNLPSRQAQLDVATSQWLEAQEERTYSLTRRLVSWKSLANSRELISQLLASARAMIAQPFASAGDPPPTSRDPLAAPVAKQLIRTLERYAEVLRGSNSKFVVVYLPGRDFTMEGDDVRLVRSMLSELRGTFIDMRQLFAHNGVSPHAPNHYTPEANALVARAIADWMRAN